MLQPKEKKPNRLQAFLESFQQFRIGRQRSSSPAPGGHSQTTSPTAVIVAASAAAAMAPVTREEKRTGILKKHKRQPSISSMDSRSSVKNLPTKRMSPPRGVSTLERVTSKGRNDYYFTRRFLAEERLSKYHRDFSDSSTTDKMRGYGPQSLQIQQEFSRLRPNFEIPLPRLNPEKSWQKTSPNFLGNAIRTSLSPSFEILPSTPIPNNWMQSNYNSVQPLSDYFTGQHKVVDQDMQVLRSHDQAMSLYEARSQTRRAWLGADPDTWQHPSKPRATTSLRQADSFSSTTNMRNTQSLLRQSSMRRSHYHKASTPSLDKPRQVTEEPEFRIVWARIKQKSEPKLWGSKKNSLENQSLNESGSSCSNILHPKTKDEKPERISIQVPSGFVPPKEQKRSFEVKVQPQPISFQEVTCPSDFIHPQVQETTGSSPPQGKKFTLTINVGETKNLDNAKSSLPNPRILSAKEPSGNPSVESNSDTKVNEITDKECEMNPSQEPIRIPQKQKPAPLVRSFSTQVRRDEKPRRVKRHKTMHQIGVPGDSARCVENSDEEELGSQDSCDDWSDEIQPWYPDTSDDPIELTYQEEFLIQEECEIPVHNDFVEKLLQTVWTDDTLDEEYNQIENGSHWATAGSEDSEYDDPSIEITIKIDAPVEDEVRKVSSTSTNLEDMYCDDELQTNLLDNPNMQLSVSRLNDYPEEEMVYPPTPMLVHRDSILTLDSENSSGPHSLDSHENPEGQ